MFSKTTNRAVLYCFWNAGTFALANLSEAMFGGSGWTRPHLTFAWVMFWIGLSLSIVAILRAFIDTTPSDESQASALLTPPKPGPDASGQARAVTVEGVNGPVTVFPQPKPNEPDQTQPS